MGTTLQDYDSTPRDVATLFHHGSIRVWGLELYWSDYLSYLLFIV